ncbi:MAG: hypothetical protein KBA53_09220 [Thermoclostridium sp.]|nr:hypothetical protein [Thermoclostridium sp.]
MKDEVKFIFMKHQELATGVIPGNSIAYYGKEHGFMLFLFDFRAGMPVIVLGNDGFHDEKRDFAEQVTLELMKNRKRLRKDRQQPLCRLVCWHTCRYLAGSWVLTFLLGPWYTNIAISWRDGRVGLRHRS